MKKAILPLVILTSLLASCGQNQSNDNQGATDMNFDSEITETERQKILSVVNGLSAEQLENFIYIDKDGEIYSNRVSSKINWSKREISNGTIDFGSGKLYAQDLIGLQSNKMTAQYYACQASDGPYYRVHTLPGNRSPSTSIGKYAFAEAQVNVSDNTSFNNNGLSSYVMLGGWGDSSNNSSGVAVDAGLSFNPIRSNNPVSDYSPFVLVNGTPYSNTQRLKPGSIKITFWVKQDNQVVLNVTGNLESTGQSITQTVVADANGWKANGTGNVIKRFNSITRYSDFIGPIKPASITHTWNGVTLGSSYNSTTGAIANQHYWDSWSTDNDTQHTGSLTQTDGKCQNTAGHPAVEVDESGYGVENVTLKW